MSEHITQLDQLWPEKVNFDFLILQDDDPNCLAVYRGENSDGRTFTVYRTDQGNANPEKRCDFLLVDQEMTHAWYIELKGKNHWDNACRQLLRTHRQFSPQLGIPDSNAFFRLVSSSTRSGMRVFRSYTSYRHLIMSLPSSRQFKVMFSSLDGIHKDYEVLEDATIIPFDEE